ncbi:hypothetical protein PMAYCL1PPCAC_33005, partial [Pristionchus mayeri]
FWAAAFATNIQAIHDKADYFTAHFDSNVLTHTWSLGVEIQYYIIVPLLVISQRMLGSRCGIVFLVVIITASMSYQCLAETNSSFNSLLARVWQFLCGGITKEVCT